MSTDPELAAGARNLLIDCAGLTPGSDLLIVYESPELGWYDLGLSAAVATEARRMGIEARLVEAGAPGHERDRNAADAIAASDRVVFFARIGDQDRFAPAAPGKTVVMCYCRDAGMLGSSYGTTGHRAMTALKQAVDEVLLGAREITITCPLGTEMTGTIQPSARGEPADVSVRRFPLGVPQPIPASTFSGRVALGRYLTPTGSRPYDPACVRLDSPVFAEVTKGRIDRFTGEPEAVAQVRAHYERVAGKFGIDADAVHSWHAGIHPGCAYRADADGDPDRWSNTVFTNPRFLHFHTCGDYAPGEICWMVLDQTVLVDSTPLWQHGRLRVDNFAQTRACLADWPELQALFATPSDMIGLPPEGFFPSP